MAANNTMTATTQQPISGREDMTSVVAALDRIIGIGIVPHPFRLAPTISITIAVTNSMPPEHRIVMKARMRRAAKRKIPKMPGKSRCTVHSSRSTARSY